MTQFLFAMLVVVGIPTIMVNSAYMTARDIVASGNGNSQTLEVVKRLGYVLLFLVVAVLMLTVYIGIRLAA